MKVEVENLNGHFKKLKIEVPAETVVRHADDYFRRIGQDVELKGFRKGKAPMNLVREFYGESSKPRITKELVEKHFFEAIRSHSFSPVAPPEVEVESYSEFGGLKFNATFENTPPIELKDYKSFKADKFEAKSATADVEKTLDSIRTQLATFEELPAGTAADKGMVFECDFEGTEAGKPVPQATGDNGHFELGAGELTPDFEKGVMGMKAGETRNFTVKFPEAKNENEVTPVAGKTIDFTVKAKALKKKVLPALDDALAKKIGPFDGIEALKSRIESDIVKEQENKHRRDQLEKAVTWLIEKNPVEAPETMIQQQMEQLAIDAGVQLQQMGLDEAGIEEQLKKWGDEMTDRAQRQVRASLLLGDIARVESIKASEEDIRQELSKMAAQARKSPKDIWEDLQSRGLVPGLVRQITELKALDFVVNGAS